MAARYLEVYAALAGRRAAHPIAGAPP
jgi:hypothetical protein